MAVSQPLVDAATLLDALKLLALVAMTIDHINVALLGRQVEVMTVIGRIAFPVFAFAAAFGALHTRSPTRYLRRLLLCALAAQPFFWFAFGEQWWYLNTVFTLLSGVATVLAWRAGWLWLAPVLLLPSIWADYGMAGAVAVPAAALLLSRSWAAIAAGGALLVAVAPDLWPTPSFLVVGALASAAALLCWSRAGCRTSPAGARYTFYIYYPAHLAVLAALNHLLA